MNMSGAEATVHFAYAGGYAERCRSDKCEVAVQLLALESLLHLPDYDKVVEVEVYAEEHEEERDHHFYVETVERSDAGRARGKAAGTGSGKGVQQRVIKAHAAEHEQHGFDYGERAVNEIEYPCGLTGARNELAHGRPGDLCAHYMHGVLVAGRQHRHY